MNAGTRPVAPTNGYDLRDGLLWIRAQNFQPDREQYAALEAMLRELRQIKGAQSIVFDVRHNGGGNSAVGDMIFEAATGGLRFDRDGIRKLPPVYAEWRVSDVSIESAKARLADALRVYGHASDETAWLREHLRSLLVAQAEGRRFARQDTGEHRVTRADVARRHGRLRNFTGRIAVLTDDSCASACLDFVDEVRLVPGSLHLGATTSADSVYIDVGIVALPSGNRLMMPLKVWRNRLRGDNEPYVPDVAFDGDLDDDTAVRAFVVDALSRHAKASERR